MIEITKATRITLAGVAAAIVCLCTLWFEKYSLVMISYLAVLASDVFDGREARRSGTSFFGHICDRLIRDPLMVIATLYLIARVDFFKPMTLFYIGEGAAFLFIINLIRAILGVKEGRRFYFFWNYGWQFIWAIAGLVSLFMLMEAREFFLIFLVSAVSVPCLCFIYLMIEDIVKLKRKDRERKKAGYYPACDQEA